MGKKKILQAENGTFGVFFLLGVRTLKTYSKSEKNTGNRRISTRGVHFRRLICVSGCSTHHNSQKTCILLPLRGVPWPLL